MIIRDSMLRPEANNLTLLRLVLASAVIWTHSYWRMTGVSSVDEVSALLGAPISAFAVDGFFFLSGLLVYASLERSNNVVHFLRSRLFRIWPGLAVAVVATVVIGGWLSGLSVAAYLHGPTLRFLIGNLSLMSSGYALTGVECGDALCNVNGSLWTIPWEVRCYLLLAALGAIGFARRSWMVRLVLPATLIFAIGFHLPMVATAIKVILGDGILYNLGMIDRLWTMFALGIAAYIFRERIYLSWWLCLAMLLGTIACAHWQLHFHFASLFTAYAALCVGFLSAKRGAVSGRWPDYSYGMYIYAFPVMMLIAGQWQFTHHGWLALANLVATLPLAALSWHWIEKPMLMRARRFGMERESRPTAVESGS